MEHKDVFLNKRCSLTKRGGFILHGTVVEVLETGVVFQTDKKTSFIGFCDIDILMPEEDY